MPVPVSDASWWGSLLWLAGLTAVAFFVAWITGTRLHIRRAAYIAILFVVTGALTAGYIAWLGVGAKDVLTTRWGWGILVGLVVGVVLALAMRTQPVDRHVPRDRLPALLLWEGVVYGTGEGMLLSGLPAFMTWQMVHSLGWSGTAGDIARWTLPVVAAAAVILLHHLGYWHCRNRILVPIVLGCSGLTVAYVATASFIAPTLGHIVMHFGAVLHGVEMPPKERPTAAEGLRPIDGRAALRAA